MLPSCPISTAISGNTTTGNPKTLTTKGEGDALFPLLLNKSFSPIRNCLGASGQGDKIMGLNGQMASLGGDLRTHFGLLGVGEKAPLLGHSAMKGLCLNDIRHILLSLRKTLAETNQTEINLVLEHPDQLVLTEFLQTCGFKEDEIPRIIEKAKGKEGQYALDVLFAMLDPKVPQAGTESPAQTSPDAPEHSLALSDLSVVSAMLQQFGLKPQEVGKITEKCLSREGVVRIDQLVKCLKDECTRPLSATPIEEWHETALADLLAKFGLTGEEIRKLAVEAGLSDKEISLPKLALMLDKAADILDRQRNPIDAGKFLDNLEQLLSKVRLETDAGQAGQDQAGVLRSWQDKWLERLREEWARLDPGGKTLTLETSPGGKFQVEGGITPAWLEEITDRLAETERQVQKPLFTMGRVPTASPPDNVVAAKEIIRPVFYPEDILPQVTDRIIGSLRLKEDQVVIKLFPPHLGEVKVNLVFKNDQLNTIFTLDNPRVKEIVENGLPELKIALTEQGIKMGECHVELSQDFSQLFGEQEQYTWRFGPSYRGGNGQDAWVEENVESIPIDPGNSRAPGIDVFA